MRYIVLLRGINLGSRNRVAMPALREALTDAGFEDVSTYVQSGNVVLSSTTSAQQVAKTCERAIEQRFGLDIAVVVRTRAQISAVVRKNPLKEATADPKRYQVTFLDKKLDAKTVDELGELVAGEEQFVAAGRELFAWHPAGVARSKLWNRLAGRGLGVTATTRNWTTVTKLLELADA